MRKKFVSIIIVAFCIGILCVSIGCSSSDSNNNPTVTPISSVIATVTPTPIPTLSGPPNTVSWISPGKVLIGNFYPGATVEYSMTVHNGNDYVATFIIKARYPDNTGSNIKRPVANDIDALNCGNCFVFSNLSDCVTFGVGHDAEIGTEEIALSAYETRDVDISFTLPVSEVVPSNWEFWISVIDSSQSGFVHTELCSRWIVTMR